MTLIRRGERSEVRREITDGQPVVVKAYRTADEGWVREAAGLALVGRLLAETIDPPTVTTPDLGVVPSVADRLLASDPDEATRAVVAWARAIGRLHARTVGRRGDLQAAIDARAGARPVAAATSGGTLSEAARALERRAADLGVVVDIRVGALIGRLSPDHPAASLSPGDTCPDNALLVADEVELIDFESVEWRHAAWDAAYLTVPWPSCWCSWRLPDDVARRALDALRTELASTVPYVATDAFETDVAAARTAWTFISADWFLERALGSDPLLHPDAPSRRAMLLHRLSTCGDESAAVLADALRSRWGDVPLDLAPAYR